MYTVTRSSDTFVCLFPLWTSRLFCTHLSVRYSLTRFQYSTRYAMNIPALQTVPPRWCHREKSLAWFLHSAGWWIGFRKNASHHPANYWTSSNYTLFFFTFLHFAEVSQRKKVIDSSYSNFAALAAMSSSSESRSDRRFRQNSISKRLLPEFGQA